MMSTCGRGGAGTEGLSRDRKPRVMTRAVGPIVAQTPEKRAFAVWGDPEGFPILALHGTPGCRLVRWPREELYADLGVCSVTHDRAGYGRSDRNHRVAWSTRS